MNEATKYLLRVELESADREVKSAAAALDREADSLARAERRLRIAERLACELKVELAKGEA